jgi:3-hydroxybutyryl-CoA dehydrogenase
VEAKDVNRVGVVGFRSHGFRHRPVLAGVGIEVVVLEPTEELLARGRERVDARSAARPSGASSTIRNGTRSSAGSGDDRRRVARRRSAGHRGPRREDRDAKLAIFRELDRVVGPDAILATNTSSIPIATLASVTSRPDKVRGSALLQPRRRWTWWR